MKNLPLLAERSKWKEGIQGTGLASKSLDNMLIFKKKILIHGTNHLIFQLCVLFSARQEKSLKK